RGLSRASVREREGSSRAIPDDACPKCGCDDPSMLELVKGTRWFCNNCSHDWDRSTKASAERSAKATAMRSGTRGDMPRGFASLDDLVAWTGSRRDEIVTLADIGALNSFGYDRRSALWQAERAVRSISELFADDEDIASSACGHAERGPGDSE